MDEGIFASSQVGVPESWCDVIMNIEAETTPLTSMLKKDKKPANMLDNWQADKYKSPSHKGVPDGEDVEKYENLTNRRPIQGRVQKIWRNPKTSDMADHVNTVAGLSGDEHANQIRIGLTLVKRGIEARVSSNEDSQEDTGETDAGSETRGAAKWLDTSAQGDLPVHAEFRSPAENHYTGTLANFDVETDFRTMSRSASKQRKGPTTRQGFVGVDLMGAFVNSTIYTPDKANFTAVRRYNGETSNKEVNFMVEVVKDEGGTTILHPSHYLYLDKDGEPTDYTHRSGLFLDIDMFSLAFNRMPRVLPQQNRGGGDRTIIDAIFLLRCYNPLGHGKAEINS